MKKTLTIVGFLGVTLLVYWYFSSENAFTSPPRPEKTDPLTFKMEKIERQSGECDTPESRCLTIKMEYPVATGGTEEAREKINDFIRRTLIESIIMGETNESIYNTPLDTLLTDLEEDYNDFLEDSPDYGMGWAFEVAGEVRYHSDRYASIEIDQYSFTGGAHPNTYIVVGNFDLQTGKWLAIEDITTDTTALKNILETKFRKKKELDPEIDLEQAGYWFPKGKFTFPEFFALDAAGLYFVYNSYEVASYAEGRTELMVGKEEFNGWKIQW